MQNQTGIPGPLPLGAPLVGLLSYNISRDHEDWGKSYIEYVNGLKSAGKDYPVLKGTFCEPNSGNTTPDDFALFGWNGGEAPALPKDVPWEERLILLKDLEK
jgi:hypothetical protein